MKTFVFDESTVISNENKEEFKEIESIRIKKGIAIRWKQLSGTIFPNLKTVILESASCFPSSGLYNHLPILHTMFLDFDEDIEEQYLELLATKTENFEVSDSNSRYSTIDGVLYSKDGKNLIKCPWCKHGTLIIPEGVEEIKEWGCSYTNISSVIFPNSLKIIHTGGFSGDTNLDNVDFKDSNPCYILSYAFKDCRNISKINIPDSVTYIGEAAFYKCSRLTDVKLSKNLEKIGNYAFAKTMFQKINIPDKIKYFGRQCFASANVLVTNILTKGIVYSFAETEYYISDESNDVVEINILDKKIFFPKYMRTDTLEYLDSNLIVLSSESFANNLFIRGLNNTVCVHTAAALYAYNHDEYAAGYLKQTIDRVLIQDIINHNEKQVISLLKLNIVSRKVLENIHKQYKSKLSVTANAYFLQAIQDSEYVEDDSYRI